MIARLIYFLLAISSLMPAIVSIEALGFPKRGRRFAVRGLTESKRSSPLHYPISAFFGLGIFTFIALSTMMLAESLSCACDNSLGLW
jgi:hypothetical protein